MVLNNIGISLLQRGADNAAIKALSFAVKMIREVTNDSALEPELSLALINEVLLEANRNLALCQMNDRLTVANNETVFQVITHEDILHFAKVEPDSPATMQLIRMEMNATSISDMTSYYPAIESSILLQNLGSAYMGLALKEEYNETALEKRRCACGLFRLSFYILETLCQEPCPQNNDELTSILLPILVLTLQSLKYTTSVLGLMSEYVHFDSHLSRLRPELHSVIYEATNYENAPARAA